MFVLRTLIAIMLAACAAGQVYAQKLLQPGEEVLFSFCTGHDKKVVIASDTAGRYLVYRYGTNRKVELQYPALLDSSSWRKFSYSGIIRGQGFDGTGALDLNFLAFCNRGYRYIIYDVSYENSEFSVGVKVQDTLTQKETNFRGKYKTLRGDLSIFRGNDQVTWSDRMYEH